MLFLQNFQVTFERELSMICEGFNPFVEPNTASRISHLLGYGVDPNISDDVRNISIASWNIINIFSFRTATHHCSVRVCMALLIL